VVKKLSKLPIIVDVSHGTGHSDFIIPLARAAVAVGADGLMVEVHPDPRRALCDGAQSLDLKEFEVLVAEVRKIAKTLKKKLA
jgi:3-deoxy-7-phosphoheptulonate synthase